MNRFETWFCGSPFWRYVTRRQLLPWILQSSELGEHLLELGAGPGAATEELGRLATRVTSLEYDHAFAEIARVLRPGGVFLAFEIQDSWLHRVGHIQSTFVPVTPASAFARLITAGFSKVTVDFRRGGFRIRALRARKS